MKFVLILFLFTNVFSYAKCADPPNLHLTSGNTTDAPVGVITGYASTNVQAYSNGYDNNTSHEYYYLYGVFMGIKWQCVEYARRWLFIRKGCVFDSIKGAADMWTQLDNVRRVIDGKHFALKKFPNGSPDPPKNESLLIYKREGADMPSGHVAVIVDVLPGFIRVAEENYDAHYWTGNYSRQIQYKFINGSYWIEDEYPILGWMVLVDDYNQTKPLDQVTIDEIIKLNKSSSSCVCHSLLFLNSLIFVFHFLVRSFSH